MHAFSDILNAKAMCFTSDPVFDEAEKLQRDALLKAFLQYGWAWYCIFGCQIWNKNTSIIDLSFAISEVGRYWYLDR